MKKRILSVMSSLIMAGCILGTSSVAVNAQENEKIVDGSVLTTDDTRKYKRFRSSWRTSDDR